MLSSRMELIRISPVLNVKPNPSPPPSFDESVFSSSQGIGFFSKLMSELLPFYFFTVCSEMFFIQLCNFDGTLISSYLIEGTVKDYNKTLY